MAFRKFGQRTTNLATGRTGRRKGGGEEFPFRTYTATTNRTTDWKNKHRVFWSLLKVLFNQERGTNYLAFPVIGVEVPRKINDFHIPLHRPPNYEFRWSIYLGPRYWSYTRLTQRTIFIVSTATTNRRRALQLMNRRTIAGSQVSYSYSPDFLGVLLSNFFFLVTPPANVIVLLNIAF